MAFLFQLPAGYYESAGACFSEINQAILRSFSPIPKIREERPFSDAIKTNFVYDPDLREFKTIHTGFTKVQFVARDTFLLNSLGFRMILIHNHKPVNGFDHERIFYVFEAISHGKPNLLARTFDTSLYISSDILKLQTYGKGYEPLLGIVPILPQTSGQIYWKPTTPFYLSLKTNILDTIEIWIKNEKREPFPFKPQSKAVLRLHFRRKQSFD